MNAAVTPESYARAVEIPGLDPERQASLVGHIQSRNQALSNCSPITPAVARYAPCSWPPIDHRLPAHSAGPGRGAGRIAGIGRRSSDAELMGLGR
jgi:hypothetical protein